jgi:hypothetical protein
MKACWRSEIEFLYSQMKEVLDKASPELVGDPLFVGVLSDKQWHQLSELQKELQEEYHMRREMLIKRLDVTIHSFHPKVAADSWGTFSFQCPFSYLLIL